jgi:hypothetical protein
LASYTVMTEMFLAAGVAIWIVVFGLWVKRYRDWQRGQR